MTATTQAPPRILTLDTVRGLAVMGILAMNIVGFAMPFQAYGNPLAYGTESVADMASWAFSYVFIDGRMRGLFSFLFGASILLVIQRAQGAGRSAAAAHYQRMGWLLGFGIVHFYLIWFGDILIGYAIIGMLAFLFRNRSVRGLLIWGAVFFALQMLLMTFGAFYFTASEAAATAPGASAEAISAWTKMASEFAPPTPAKLAEDLALYRGSYEGIVQERTTTMLTFPFVGLFFFGWETLAYMLFGMAALRSGMLTGAWEAARYRRIALGTLAIGLPLYAVAAWFVSDAGFAVTAQFYANTATTILRPLVFVGYAALIVLLTRDGGGLTERIAAAGRMAFTNYLGTSIVMTTLFYGYGLGLYGHLSRIELWLPVMAMWAGMLLWSKPWLERFEYGPLEWMWRSLSRRRLEPMRRRLRPAVA